MVLPAHLPDIHRRVVVGKAADKIPSLWSMEFVLCHGNDSPVVVKHMAMKKRPTQAHPFPSHGGERRMTSCLKKKQPGLGTREV